jgi:hypothetical protein
MAVPAFQDKPEPFAGAGRLVPAEGFLAQFRRFIKALAEHELFTKGDHAYRHC